MLFTHKTNENLLLAEMEIDFHCTIDPDFRFSSVDSW